MQEGDKMEDKKEITDNLCSQQSNKKPRDQFSNEKDDKQYFSDDSLTKKNLFENQCMLPIQYAQKQIQEMNEKVLPVLNSIKQDYSNNTQKNPNISQEDKNEQEKKIDNQIKSVFEQLGLIPKWMLTRTCLCKHKFGCYKNVLFGFYQTFITSLAVKFLVNNIGHIFSIKRLFKNITSLKSNKDNLRFAFFLALMNATYKFFLCILRRIVKNDKICAPIAGFIAGLTCRLDLKSRRQLMTVLIVSRVADTSYTMAESRGYVKKFAYGEVLLWLVCNMFQQYCMGYERDLLNKGQYHFMKKWSQMSGNPEQLMDQWNKKIRDQIRENAPSGWVVNFGNKQ